MSSSDLFRWSIFVPDPLRSSYDNLQSLFGVIHHSWSKLQGDDPTTSALRVLVESFVQASQAYYGKAIELLSNSFVEFPDKGITLTHIQNRFYNKIESEWQLLSTLASANGLFEEEPEKYKVLKDVITNARSNLILDEQINLAVIPRVSANFNLLRFTYAPHIRLLGIPFRSVNQPADWSVIYHEMAGLLIEQRREELVDHLQELLERQPGWNGLLTSAERDTLTGATARNRERNWLEEFIEDAVSVFSLGSSLLPRLAALLEQFYPISGAGDERHPPRDMRVALAHALVHRASGKVPDTDNAYMRILADAVWAMRSEIVKKVFDEADEAAVEDIVENYHDCIEASTPLPANYRLAAILKLAQRNNVPTATLWDLLSQCQDPEMDLAKAYSQAGAKIDEFINAITTLDIIQDSPLPSGQEKLDEWDCLLHLLFSWVDPFGTCNRTPLNLNLKRCGNGYRQASVVEVADITSLPSYCLSLDPVCGWLYTPC